MNLAKENVKNTPTEIKYHAGLHRKAMEQNVKDFKEGIAGERNRRETGRLQERNRIRQMQEKSVVKCILRSEEMKLR